MAKFQITESDSVLVTANSSAAFSGDTAAADTLIVDAGAFLVATGSLSFGAVLGAAGGAWKATINGSIVSNSFPGLFLSQQITGMSTITVGTEGEIGGGLSGMTLESRATVKNAGAIRGTTDGIVMSVAGTVTNSGLIAAGSLLNDAIRSIGPGANKVTNSGTIDGRVLFGDGNDTLTNSGLIAGRVDLGLGKNKFTNSGATGQLQITGGTNTFTNSGGVTTVGVTDGINTFKNSA
jgi:hypothetical protein